MDKESSQDFNITPIDHTEDLPPIKLEEYMGSIENELNDLIMNPETSGYSSLEEQDISYGITVSVGIDPTHDTVLDLGAGIGEFFSYVERFTGNRLNKYIAVENNENISEIRKFRYAGDQTVIHLEIDYTDFTQNYKDFNPEALKNLQGIGYEDKIDWVVSCNGITDEMTPDEIFDVIRVWSSVPEKGAAFTFKLTNTELMVDVLSKIFTSSQLTGKVIVRSDFSKNWYSIYIYNLRQ